MVKPYQTCLRNGITDCQRKPEPHGKDPDMNHSNRFRPATLEKLASYICGDEPLPFPYRSSSKLTAFFTGLDLDYIHHGETRNTWVRECLIDLSRKKGAVGSYSSSDSALYAVIEEIMNPDYFDGLEEGSLEKGLEMINRTLLSYQLEVVFDQKQWKSTLVSTDGKFVSTAHRSPEKATKITFSPRVFEIPNDLEPQRDLVALMMPFGGFDGVHTAIKNACKRANLKTRRADDIWDNDTILQDIFDLIYAAEIVIADFTNKNPNVMYETGVAHTLGKHVIPITQTLEHIPSNLTGHRALKYVGANSQGLSQLESDLFVRLTTIMKGRELGNADSS